MTKNIENRISDLEKKANTPNSRDPFSFYRSVSEKEFMELAQEAEEKGLYLSWETGKLETYEEYEKRVGPKWAAVEKRNREQIAKLPED